MNPFKQLTVLLAFLLLVGFWFVCWDYQRIDETHRHELLNARWYQEQLEEEKRELTKMNETLTGQLDSLDHLVDLQEQRITQLKTRRNEQMELIASADADDLVQLFTRIDTSDTPFKW